MNKLKKILFFLTPSERKHGILLLVIMIIMALLDMIGVASILPFVNVLTNPDLIKTNNFLNYMFEISKIFGVTSNKEFLFFLGVLVFFFLIISLIFKAFVVYIQELFVKMRVYSISKRLTEGYLNQPYSWYLNRNSADLSKSILSEVGTAVAGGLSPIMELISKGMVVIALLTLLIIYDPILSITIGFFIGTIYGFIYTFLRNFLSKIGKERLNANKQRFTSISEAFGAFKEVKVGGLEKTYIERFSKSAYTFARHQASSAIIGQLPRFAIEGLVFGGMILVILYLISQIGDFSATIPIIALYAFAGYRLMPAIQQIYVSFTQLRFIGPSLDLIYEDVKNLKRSIPGQDNDKIQFSESITLKEINFSYPNSSRRTILNNININIKANTTVGLVGSTGSGKTTIVDIILGLLDAQKGTLEVDGKIITKNNCRAWQKSIGYVPQNIYLADDTVAANIAFGIDSNKIDEKAVKSAAKIANLDEFVLNELPKQYETNIGDQGIKLSGGQRQRIGIARALYHNPDLLILDEATSALDNLNEKIVMDAINTLDKKITIILIAHRLNTLKKCHNIFVLDKGSMVGQGTFDQLKKTNKEFKKMYEANDN